MLTCYDMNARLFISVVINTVIQIDKIDIWNNVWK